MTHKVIWWRPAVLLIGVLAAGISCIGAYEYAHKLEGKWSYLVAAAPVIAAIAALAPVIAHWSWAYGERVRAVLWWLIPLPLAAAVAFFAAAERNHAAKAGAQAERMALTSASERARSDLLEAQRRFDVADRTEAKFRGAKQCGPQCRASRETLLVEHKRLDFAKQALAKAEALAIQEAPLVAPVWLLPTALDVVAFFAIWSGLGGPWRKPVVQEAPKPARRRRKKTKRPPASSPRIRLVASNGNEPTTA